MAFNAKQKNIIKLTALFVVMVMIFILYNAITFKSEFYTLNNETCVANNGVAGLYNECIYPLITDENVCQESGGWMREMYSEPKFNTSTNDYYQDILNVSCVAYYGDEVRFK